MEKFLKFEVAIQEVHGLLRNGNERMTQALFNMNCAYESLGDQRRPSHSIQVVLAYLWSNHLFSGIADQALRDMLAFGDELTTWREFARVVSSGSLGNPNGIPRLQKLLERSPEQDGLMRGTALLLLGRDLRRSDPNAAVAAYQAVITCAAGGSPIHAVAERELERFVNLGLPRFMDDVHDD